MSVFKTLISEIDNIEGDDKTIKQVKKVISSFSGQKLYIPSSNVQEKVAAASKMLENGMPRSEVKTVLQYRFDMSSRRAYETIIKSFNERTRRAKKS